MSDVGSKNLENSLKVYIIYLYIFFKIFQDFKKVLVDERCLDTPTLSSLNQNTCYKFSSSSNPVK